jgi:hypothetical protein
MSSIQITETGLLAMVGMVIGFIISFCKTAEQSRCKEINVCCGAISCNREPLSGETILEMNDKTQEALPSENNIIVETQQP